MGKIRWRVSTRGHPQMCKNGYTYNRDKQYAESSTWECIFRRDRGCRARVKYAEKIVTIIGQHNHQPDEGKSHVHMSPAPTFTMKGGSKRLLYYIAILFEIALGIRHAGPMIYALLDLPFSKIDVKELELLAIQIELVLEWTMLDPIEQLYASGMAVTTAKIIHPVFKNVVAGLLETFCIRLKIPVPADGLRETFLSKASGNGPAIVQKQIHCEFYGTQLEHDLTIEAKKILAKGATAILIERIITLIEDVAGFRKFKSRYSSVKPIAEPEPRYLQNPPTHPPAKYMADQERNFYTRVNEVCKRGGGFRAQHVSALKDSPEPEDAKGKEKKTSRTLTYKATEKGPKERKGVVTKKQKLITPFTASAPSKCSKVSKPKKRPQVEHEEVPRKKDAKRKKSSVKVKKNEDKSADSSSYEFDDEENTNCSADKQKTEDKHKTKEKKKKKKNTKKKKHSHKVDHKLRFSRLKLVLSNLQENEVNGKQKRKSPEPVAVKVLESSSSDDDDETGEEKQTEKADFDEQREPPSKKKKVETESSSSSSGYEEEGEGDEDELIGDSVAGKAQQGSDEDSSSSSSSDSEDETREQSMPTLGEQTTIAASAFNLSKRKFGQDFTLDQLLDWMKEAYAMSRHELESDMQNRAEYGYRMCTLNGGPNLATIGNLMRAIKTAQDAMCDLTAASDWTDNSSPLADVFYDFLFKENDGLTILEGAVKAYLQRIVKVFSHEHGRSKDDDLYCITNPKVRHLLREINNWTTHVHAALAEPTEEGMDIFKLTAKIYNGVKKQHEPVDSGNKVLIGDQRLF